MDSLRGGFGSYDAEDPLDLTEEVDVHGDEETVDIAPPPAIGQDERRMQVRAYNFWASMLEDRNFPSIEDLDPTLLPDFGPHSVLLDFSDGIEDPSINFIGDKLAHECAADRSGLPQRLSQVPPRSLLSRITDHYMQILANQSPIGFEAEFVNATSSTILYRGILLPFSSDDETIDFIYGVINWKEMADAKQADELLLEIDQALDGESGARTPAADALTDWADGPAGGSVSAERDDEAASELPRPSFDLSGQTGHDDEVADAFDPEDGSAGRAMVLADWLAAARDMAQQASRSEERTRAALYEAVGRAYDFALAAAQEPQDFADLLDDAGIAMQDRAPMTPVVKLVFGPDYDKTRLTEYAAVLGWAQRHGIVQGALGQHLKTAEGGLKAIVGEERAFRRGQDVGEAAPARTGPRKAIARKLRAMAPQGFNALGQGSGEFGLVMIRRTETGEVVMLGEVPQNASLIEKAARELIG